MVLIVCGVVAWERRGVEPYGAADGLGRLDVVRRHGRFVRVVLASGSARPSPPLVSDWSAASAAADRHGRPRLHRRGRRTDRSYGRDHCHPRLAGGVDGRRCVRQDVRTGAQGWHSGTGRGARLLDGAGGRGAAAARRLGRRPGGGRARLRRRGGDGRDRVAPRSAVGTVGGGDGGGSGDRPRPAAVVSERCATSSPERSAIRLWWSATG